MTISRLNHFRLLRSSSAVSRALSVTQRRQTLSNQLNNWLATVGLVLCLSLICSGSPAFGGAASASSSTPTYAGLLLHNKVTTPIKVAAGATVNMIAPINGTDPMAAAYGAHIVATVFVQGGPTGTTCTVKVAGGAVSSPALTVPANATVSIVLCDTSPGTPGEPHNVGLTIQAGKGGPLTIVAPTSLTLEVVASKPGNNAY